MQWIAASLKFKRATSTRTMSKKFGLATLDSELKHTLLHCPEIGRHAPSQEVGRSDPVGSSNGEEDRTDGRIG